MIKSALSELVKDERDFTLGSLVPKKADVPLVDFEVGNAEIEDQGDSMLCTLYASTKALELKDSIRRSPFYNALKVQEGGADVYAQGTDLRTACKTFVDYGSLSVQDAPADISSTNDWHNLPAKFDIIAEKLAESSYLAVTGYEDTFSSVQSFLWANKRAIVTGMPFRTSWEYTLGGVVSEVYEPNGSNHAFIWVGQKMINGQAYLKAQLSNGTEIGDKGYFYFSKNVVNREAYLGNFSFIDYPPEIIKILMQYGLSLRWVWLARLLNYFDIK